MAIRLFSYVVKYDIGFAPNPFHGWCTLATCKPGIRAKAEVDDWLMGTGSKSKGLQGKVVFAMRVTKILTFDEYWKDPNFNCKKPKFCGSLKQAYGDNVYHLAPSGWIQADSRHSFSDGSPNPGHVSRDTSANRVLISNDYVYFGSSGPEFPPSLRPINSLDPVQNGRGYSCRFPQQTVDDTVGWLRTLGTGVQGQPADWNKRSRRFHIAP
jgi:hypothetical protein